MAVESPRLEALKALTTLLEGIVPSPDGYTFDLAGKVFRGRTVFGAESPTTMISILEGTRPGFAVSAGENDSARSEKWPILLQGWCPDDTEHPTDRLYLMAAEVENRLHAVRAVHPHTGAPVDSFNYMLGRRITSIDWDAPVVRPPTEGISPKAFFYLALRLGLA